MNIKLLTYTLIRWSRYECLFIVSIKKVELGLLITLGAVSWPIIHRMTSDICTFGNDYIDQSWVLVFMLAWVQPASRYISLIYVQQQCCGWYSFSFETSGMSFPPLNKPSVINTRLFICEVRGQSINLDPWPLLTWCPAEEHFIADTFQSVREAVYQGGQRWLQIWPDWPQMSQFCDFLRSVFSTFWLWPI